ncbi:MULTISPECIES: hypothetical protein [Acidovorax]|uniref:Uncharacterized protein n=1 Tax=Acidovorax facilis TaxID=12917 RepID=A0ABV8D809_9BURK|nr:MULTISPECIES: hypothetical protein [Acidovorax]KQB58018.1 hypothetical protein AE621_17885 [Acidovorax sp. SD340]MBO1008291.1 hypothetical protein [Acidovorax sp. SD340]MCO4243473.1 hypothetical protein [Acidovorax facilis]
MHITHRISTTVALLAMAAAAVAQPQEFATAKAAVAALFPNQTFVEWTSTAGNWNGDGVQDLALILNEVDGPVDRPMEIRLVVLAGKAGGAYTPLSASSSYCMAQKFYNLEAKGTSLWVTAVDKAEGDVSATTTLQFRFSPRRGDFELIGKENVWEVQGKEYGRSSVNYLTGKFITYERVKGRVKVSKEKRFVVPSLALLNGFNCNTYDDGVSP